MHSISISPRFNKKNLLELFLENTSKQKLIDIKICFSLVYSIESLEPATIFKKVGRYYELILEQNIIYPGESRKIILKLQKPRIGSYNLSCGPEGLFILKKNNDLINVKINNLVFQEPIKRNFFIKKIRIGIMIFVIIIFR